MRISDWSSDVCSSDLVMLVSARIVAAALLLFAGAVAAAPRPLIAANSRIEFSIKEMGVTVSGQFTRFDAIIDLDPMKPEPSSAKLSVDKIGRASCRERVWQYV